VPSSVIYQSGRLSDNDAMRADFALARQVEREGVDVGRIYAIAGGAVVALAHALVRTARARPERFTPLAAEALDDFERYFSAARRGDLRRFNLRRIASAPFSLEPLRRWLDARLCEYLVGADTSLLRLSDLTTPIYLCVLDRDGHPSFLGPPDANLAASYFNCRVGVEDAPVLDAVVAALSEVLWYEPALVNGRRRKGGRPILADISGLVLDLEATAPRPLRLRRPRTPLPGWPANALTRAFIMHRWHERNQAELTAHYCDLVSRKRALDDLAVSLRARLGAPARTRPDASAQIPQICNVRLPYTGSTRVDVNMRESIANRQELQRRFLEIGAPQLEGFPLDRPFTLIYGAGGFSGIVAGLTMARLIDRRQGAVRRLFGISSGVLNGLFHSVALAAQCHPQRFTAAARTAVDSFEAFFDQLTELKLAQFNRRPDKIYRGLGNLDPLRAHLRRFLVEWTGQADVDDATFSALSLPLYVVTARAVDGYPEFFGDPGQLEMRYAGRTVRPVDAPVLDALMAGLAQPFYVSPQTIHGAVYLDGGAASYNVELFAAAMEPELPDLVSVHVADPEDFSYGLAEHPRALDVAFDIHNLTFPEQRRRMTALAELLYAHEAQRRELHAVVARAQARGETLADLETEQLEPGWWRSWELA